MHDLELLTVDVADEAIEVAAGSPRDKPQSVAFCSALGNCID